jgi:UDP-glucose 4-epimerase
MGSMFRVSKDKINENNDDYIIRFLAGMKVLVTGINGFIGRYVAKLLSTRHEVFGTISQPTQSHFSSLVKLISTDFSDPTFVDSLPPNIDCVIHLAQSKEYRNFPAGAEDMRRINIDATCQLLDWSSRTGVKKFIFSSTANVYGKTTEVLLESHPTQPESFYGATKLAAEHLARQYQTNFQVDILRLFTVYGPNQKAMLVPNIANRIMQGKLITLAGGAGVHLSPIYVEDVSRIISQLIEKKSTNKFRLLNVCGDERTSLADIVRSIERVLNKKAIIKLSKEEVPYFVGNNNLLKEQISNYTLRGLESGISKTFTVAKMSN